MTTLRTLNPDILAFLDRRLGDQHGLICIGYIDGDPSLKRGKPGYTPLKQEWYKTLHEAAERLSVLAETTAGNIYAGVRRHATQKRTYATAIDSDWLWLDDVDPDSFEFTEIVQTSERSAQAGIQIDQHVPATVARDLVKRIRQHIGGKSDKCSSDQVHMMRVPGGYNSKRHGRFPVAVDTFDGKVWSLAELDALLPALAAPQRTTAVNESATLDPLFWRKVAHHLSNIDSLLAANRVNIIKPETQAGRILADDLSQFLTPEGEPDRSMNAYALANGLHLRGFPAEEVAAIVFHKYDLWQTVLEKGSLWAQIDIADRIIYKIHANRPDIRTSPTTYRAMLTSDQIPYTEPSRARKDRAQRITAPSLLAWYRQQAGDSGVVMLTRREIAERLGVSLPTLDRHDETLRKSGAIERKTERTSGNYSYVVINDIPHQNEGVDDDNTLAAVAVGETSQGVLSSSDVQPVSTAPECDRSETAVVPYWSNTTSTALLVEQPAAPAEPQPAPQRESSLAAWRRANGWPDVFEAPAAQPTASAAPALPDTAPDTPAASASAPPVADQTKSEGVVLPQQQNPQEAAPSKTRTPRRRYVDDWTPVDYAALAAILEPSASYSSA